MATIESAVRVRRQDEGGGEGSTSSSRTTDTQSNESATTTDEWPSGATETATDWSSSAESSIQSIVTVTATPSVISMPKRAYIC